MYIHGVSNFNGISFSLTKYSAKFESQQDLTKIYLYKNKYIETNKLLDFMKSVPFIRGFFYMLNDWKTLLIAFIICFVINILSKNVNLKEINIILKNINFESLSINQMLIYILFCLLLFLLLWILLLFLGGVVYFIIKNTLYKNYSQRHKLMCQYHSAEHKVVITYCKGVPLTLENCKKSSSISNNCSLVFEGILVLVAIILKAILFIFNLKIHFSIYLLFIWIISYEMFLIERDIPLLRWRFKLGHLLQKYLFTLEPTDLQLNQAIETFKLLLRAETDQIPKEELKELLQNGKKVEQK